MKLFSQVRVRLQKDLIVRISRNLQGSGTIKAAQDQQVAPSDIIGTGFISAGFRTLNLAQLLQVPPKDVQKYMKRALGQRIYQDELLAYKSGGFFGGKKVITSPADGVLDFLNPETGELRMTFLPKKEDLPAGVYGIIDNVDKERGKIVIRTQASLVHGMFGSGKTRDGTLHIISKRDELAGKELISAKYNEQILAGGSLVFKDAITAAISAGASGIITGGINAKDYKGMAGGRVTFPKKLENDVGISIIVCEGFGPIPIGEDIHEILKAYDGKFVSIDGNAAVLTLPSFESSSIIKVKNTKLPPFIQDSRLTASVELKNGLKVRVIGNSYPGEQGKIVAVDQSETVLPSGIKTYLATVETPRRKIRLPVANFEVIEYSL